MKLPFFNKERDEDEEDKGGAKDRQEERERRAEMANVCQEAENVIVIFWIIIRKVQIIDTAN